jgi:glycosyltransferase involved in cell wall biosynthesis
MKDQEFISVVLYTHNNQFLIDDTLRRILNFINARFINFEIIVVNDSSIDETKNEIKKFIKENDNSRITLINLAFKHGLETAICVGVDFSVGDFVIELDSPVLSFNENIIFDLYKKSCEGFDIVSLKSYKNRDSSSSFFYFLLNHFSTAKIEYDTEICSILTRRAVNGISKIKDKTKYRKILHNYSGYTKGSLTINLESKIKSSAGFSEKVKMASDILFSFTDIGYKINLYMTMLFLAISIFIGCYSIYQYLFNEKVIEGWTTIMLFISFSFSGIFILLSIINKYFSIVLKEIRNMPQYTIESIDKN